MTPAERVGDREPPCEITEILARCRSGDTQAWEELFLLSHSAVYWAARATGASHETAEDVVGDVFVKLIEDRGRCLSRAQFRDARDFRQWVAVIARHLCLDENRSPWVARRMSLDEHGHHQAVPQTEEGDPEEELVERVTTRAAIERELAYASPRERFLIVLHYLEDMSMEMIADMTGTPIGTVSAAISRGRRRMREALQQNVGHAPFNGWEGVCPRRLERGKGLGRVGRSREGDVTPVPESCADILELAAYVTGNLVEEDRTPLERHCTSCEACRRRLVEIYRASRGRGREAVRELPPVTLSRARQRVAEALAAWAQEVNQGSVSTPAPAAASSMARPEKVITLLPRVHDPAMTPEPGLLAAATERRVPLACVTYASLEAPFLAKAGRDECGNLVVYLITGEGTIPAGTRVVARYQGMVAEGCPDPFGAVPLPETAARNPEKVSIEIHL